MFDLFLIGSAASILAAMVGEYFVSRGPAVGRATNPAAVRRSIHSPSRTAGRAQRPQHGLRVGARS
jgi:hypothetical protein